MRLGANGQPLGIAASVCVVRRDSQEFQGVVDRLHPRAICRDLPRAVVEEAVWRLFLATVEEAIADPVTDAEIEPFLREVQA